MSRTENLLPRLHSEHYVFCTVDGDNPPMDALARAHAMIKEKEGMSLVLLKEDAEAMAFDCSDLMACISLDLGSSLLSIGLTASISEALSAALIPCNVIAGYYHDHIFVPVDEASSALEILKELEF